MESAQLLKHLRDAIACKIDEVPDGWKTTFQWANEWGISSNAAGILLSRAIKVGAVERKLFRIKTDGRGVYPTPHYRKANKA